MTEHYSDVCMSCKPIKSDKKTVLTAFECKCLLLYCFWYLQMNSTGMELKAHLDQKSGQQRSSVFPKHFLGLEVSVELHSSQILLTASSNPQGYQWHFCSQTPTKRKAAAVNTTRI